MGITCKIKRISISTLELFQQDPLLLYSFFDAQSLPESPFWHQRKWPDEYAEKTKQEARSRLTKSLQDRNRSKTDHNLQDLESQLLSEWEIPELDLLLHKNYYRSVPFNHPSSSIGLKL
jgi:hypothetical protein